MVGFLLAKLSYRLPRQAAFAINPSVGDLLSTAVTLEILSVMVIIVRRSR